MGLRWDRILIGGLDGCVDCVTGCWCLVIGLQGGRGEKVWVVYKLNS